MSVKIIRPLHIFFLISILLSCNKSGADNTVKSEEQIDTVAFEYPAIVNNNSIIVRPKPEKDSGTTGEISAGDMVKVLMRTKDKHIVDGR
jgi:uncharacterized protein YgiM (DUF1202 family)